MDPKNSVVLEDYSSEAEKEYLYLHEDDISLLDELLRQNNDGLEAIVIFGKIDEDDENNTLPF